MSLPNHDTEHQIVLGCIADDVTGATDLAINLVQGGMRVIQVLDVPTADELQRMDADAVVVALKTRSIPKNEAVRQSLAVLNALRNAGVGRFYFKYCSTFDSTPDGNIGPVAVALRDALGCQQTVFCPAFPRTGRTVYLGHLFVNDALLSESGMQHHPLNPMDDANLVRVLGAQVDEPVGLLSHADLRSERSQSKLVQLQADGYRLVITDTCCDEHLEWIAATVVEHTFVTGGSGLARFLPAAYQRTGRFIAADKTAGFVSRPGRQLILSGSCSAATNRQVAHMLERCDAWQVNVESVIADATTELGRLSNWADQQDGSRPLMVYSTVQPDSIARLQTQHDGLEIGRAVEAFLANVASSLVQRLRVTQLIVAGGETSGAVMQELGVRALRIGPEICAGVPWTQSSGESSIAIALKSGNFGDDTFFAHALEMLS